MRLTARLRSAVRRLGTIFIVGALLAAGLSVVAIAPAQASSLTFTNRTTTSGLGSNVVYGVYAVGSTVYAATDGGLSISTNGGTSFTNYTIANGLGNNTVNGVYAVGSTVYAATSAGLSISTDGGANFTNYTTANGLGNNTVHGVYAVGSTVYAATSAGLSISTDGGANFTNYTVEGSASVFGVFATATGGDTTVYAATAGRGLSITTNGGATFTRRTALQGLGSDFVNGVYAVGSTVYAATQRNGPDPGGLSISTNGGTSFTNYTIANGLGNNTVNGVYAVGSTVYAATGTFGDATVGGLSISTDGGTSFTNYTTANGLGNNTVYGVYAVGPTVYAATAGGLSMSVGTPTGFTAKSGVARFDVEWDAVPGATKYEVTGTAATGAGVNCQTVGAPPSRQCFWAPVSNGLTYTLTLVAFVGDVAGAPTAPLVTCASDGPPCDPTINTITPGDMQLTVAFSAGGAGLSAITNYEYSINDGVSWAARSPASTTSPLIITGLASGTAYSVRIRAVNGGGSGAPSNRIIATTPATPTPTPPSPPTPNPPPTPTPAPSPAATPTPTPSNPNPVQIVQSLTPAQVSQLSAADLAALPPQAFAVMTPAQVRALRPAQITSAIGRAQLRAIPAEALRAMKPRTLNAFKPWQIRALTPQQARQLRLKQVKSLSPLKRRIINDKRR